ncbi:MAG TPA: PAS domain-containing protein [Methanoregulaceae archaeon]|nr:PAS domain-containing protein [Methanoregulaceae archaeon]
MAEIKILLVENESVCGTGTRARLSAMGYDVPMVVDNPEDAAKIIRRIHPDLIIIDLTNMDDAEGIRGTEYLRQRFAIPIIIITSYECTDTFNNAIYTGIFGHLTKPLSDEKIRTSISMTLYKHTMETMMRKFEDRYHTIAELSDDLIFIVNRERLLEYANSAVLRHFSENPDTVLGKPYLKVLSAEFVENLDDFISRVIWWGEKIRRQDRVKSHQGTIWYDSSLIPLKDLDGNVNAVIVVCRDITDRVRLEEQLREEGIRQIEKNNEQFHILNDQIRNPLQVITSLMESCGGTYSAKVLEQVALIDSLVSRLDEGWLESEKVRRFLIEHYQHGQAEPMI